MSEDSRRRDLDDDDEGFRSVDDRGDDYGRDMFDRAADRTPSGRRTFAAARRGAVRDAQSEFSRDEYDREAHSPRAASRVGRGPEDVGAALRDDVDRYELVDDLEDEAVDRDMYADDGPEARKTVARDSFSRGGGGRDSAVGDAGSRSGRRGFGRKRGADRDRTDGVERGGDSFDREGFGDGGFADDSVASLGLEDEAFADERARPGPAAGRRRASAKTPRAADRASQDAPAAASSGIVWAGVFAGVLWVVGVGAFSLGYFGVPVQSVGALSAGVSSLAIHLKLMTGAAMVAPLGIVWVTVSAGRRAEALAAEARQMRSASGGADMVSANPASLQDEADRTVRALGAVESGLRAAEERAAKAREQLETERRALASLIEDFEADAGRIVEAFSQASGADGHPAVDALAEAVAQRLSTTGERAEAPRSALVARARSAPGGAERSERAPAAGRRGLGRDLGGGDFEDDAFGAAAPEPRRPWRGGSGGLDAPLDDPEPLEPYETPRFDDEYASDLDGEGDFDAPRAAGGREGAGRDADRSRDAARGRDPERGRELERGRDADRDRPRDAAGSRRPEILESALDNDGFDDDADTAAPRARGRSAQRRESVGAARSASTRRAPGRGAAPAAEAFDEPSLRNPLDDHADAEAPLDEGAAPLGGDDDAFDWGKFVRAANFPDSEDDRETLDALYAVLADAEAAALLQSAEDTLSSLADLGLYMEDLKPQHAPVETWRSFIVNGDQRQAEDLAGVRDAHALQDVVGALDDNATFADIASRFIERYEAMLERMFAHAADPGQAVELADTRTGRAYMLVGQASGRFG